jgi:hypothetical protein
MSDTAKQKKVSAKKKTTKTVKKPISKEKPGLTKTQEAQADNILDALSLLTPKQKLFVTYYTDPTSETYGDKAKSYRRAYNINTQGDKKLLQHSAITAHKEGKKPLISNAIETILHNHDYAFTVRLGQLAKIGKGVYKHKSTTTTKDKDGKVTAVHETVSTPKAGDVIKSIDTINKMEGRYSLASHAAKAESQRIQSIQNRMSAQVRKIKDVTPTHDEEVT